MSGKRQKHEEHEEHVNHERWLVTYADMITLLMVLFIVLFAMGQTDLAKYKKLRQSLATGFGGPDKMALLDGGSGINEGGASPAGVVPSEIAAKAALTTLEKRASAWKVEKAKLDDAAAALRESLKGAKSAHLIEDSQIKVAVDSRGLIITISSDVVLFSPGSATLQGGGQRILDRLASQLASLSNQITVEGHTDNIPISGGYPSNWELSTARASSVLRSFIERHGLPASRGSATGYADQRPIASNDTAQGRAKNRRVEIVVEASVSDPSVDSPDAVAAVEASHPAEPTDTQPSDTEPTDTESTDPQAPDTQPADTRPTDTQPSDTQPTAQTTSADAAGESGGYGTAADQTGATTQENAAETLTPSTTEDLHFTPIPEVGEPAKPTMPTVPTDKARTSTSRPSVTFTPSPLTVSTAAPKKSTLSPKPVVSLPTTTLRRTATETTTEQELIISPPVKPIA